MSRNSIILLLFLVFLSANAFADINDGLVAYYPFSGNANDESGNSNHGTVYGAAPAADRSGTPNGAYRFDGINDYISVPDSNSLDLSTALTVAAWIKLDSLSSARKYTSLPMNEWWDGIIDELRIYNRALSFNEIQEIKEADIIFEDDFESYAAGSYPSAGGWATVWDGVSASVTSTDAHTGSQSFRLEGRSGWSRNEIVPIPVSNFVLFECAVLIQEDNGGYYHMSLMDVEDGTWGYHYAGVNFGNGSIGVGTLFDGGTKVGTYTTGVWYHIRAYCNFVTQTMDVYINDSLIADDIPTGNTGWDSFMIAAWDGVAYFDDVVVKTYFPADLDEYWARTYGGPGYDRSLSIAKTLDGGYVLALESDSYGAGALDMQIIKLAPNGDILWQKTYGGSANDQAVSISQALDGGYIVTGTTGSFGAGDSDMWVLMLDSTGNVLWQKTFGGSGIDTGWYVEKTSDGGYIIGGHTSSYGAGSRDALFLKLDVSGDVIWQKTWGGIAEDLTTSIHQTADGGYIVAGRTESFGAGSNDGYVLKLDGLGSVEWQKTYGSSGFDMFLSSQQTADGGYVVAGTTDSFGAGSDDFWVLKLDSEGNPVWQKTYGGPGSDVAREIRQTSDGGYILTGRSMSYGAGYHDILLLKLDSAGNIVWQNTYGGSADDSTANFPGILQAPDGGFVLAGRTESFGAGDMDGLILKLDAEGNIPGCDIGNQSSATVSDTTVSGVASNAQEATQAISSSVTSASPQNSFSVSERFCPDTTPPEFTGIQANQGPGDAYLPLDEGMCFALNSHNILWTARDPNYPGGDLNWASRRGVQHTYFSYRLTGETQWASETETVFFGSPIGFWGQWSWIYPVTHIDIDGDYDIALTVEDASGNRAEEIYQITINTSDADEDNVSDCIDNCPTVCNPLQADADRDGAGDLCDDTPGCGAGGCTPCEEACPTF